MTSPGGIERGRVRIPVVPDFSRYPAQLREGLEDAVNGLASQITVTATVDADALRDSIRDAIAAVRTATVQVAASVDTSGIESDITRALSAVSSSTVRIVPDVDLASLRRQLDSIQATDLRVDVDVQGAVDDLARVARAIRTVNRIGDQARTIQVDVNADFGELDRLADLIDRIGRSRTININVSSNTITTVLTQVNSLSTALASSIPSGGIVGALVSIGVASVAIAGLVPVIGAAVAAAAPLAGALAAVGAAAAAVGLGTGGLTDAIDALGQAEANAADDAAEAARVRQDAQSTLESTQRDYARAVQDAGRAVEAANRGVATTERSVADAQRDAERAQRDLVSAREDAARQLEDYNDQLRDQGLSVRQAEISLQRAQERLGELQTSGAAVSPLDLSQAVLDVDRASADLDRARESAAGLTAEAEAARAAGVDGANGVVAAQDRLAAADQRVIDQQQALNDARSSAAQVAIDTAQQVADAQGRVAEAQQAQADAVASVASSAAAAQAALAGLSPAATAFALTAVNVRDEWAAVGPAIQEALFAGAGSALVGVSDNLLPAIEAGLPPIAAAINDIGLAFADFLADPATADALSAILASVADGLSVLAPTVGPVSDALLSFFAVTAESFPDIAPLLADLALGFADIVANLVDTGLAQELTDAGVALLAAFTPTSLAQIAALTPELVELAIVSSDLLIQVLDLNEATGGTEGLATLVGLLGAAVRFNVPIVASLTATVRDARAGLDGASGALGNLGDGFGAAGDAIEGFVADGLSGLGDAAFDAAFGLVDGLLAGITASVRGGGIGAVMGPLVDEIVSWLPGSPAEQGPLSGDGYSLYRGRALAEDFARGISSGVNLVDDAASVLASAAGDGIDVQQELTASVSATIADPAPLLVKFSPRELARQVQVGDRERSRI